MLPGAVAAFLLVHGQARCADGRQFEAEIREYRVCYVYFMKVEYLLGGPEGPEPALGRWSKSGQIQVKLKLKLTTRKR